MANPSPLSDSIWSVDADCGACDFDFTKSLWMGIALPLFCVTLGVTLVLGLFSCGITLGGSLPPSAITPLPVWADVIGRGFMPCFPVGRSGMLSQSLSVSVSLSLSSANAWYRLVSSSGGGEVC